MEDRKVQKAKAEVRTERTNIWQVREEQGRDARAADAARQAQTQPEGEQSRPKTGARQRESQSY